MCGSRMNFDQFKFVCVWVYVAAHFEYYSKRLEKKDKY